MSADKPTAELVRFADVRKSLLAGAKSRARADEVDCTLDDDSIVELWGRAHGRCEVSGLPFTDERFRDARVKHPFRPSLDRIVPGGPYTLENVRLVCVCANFSMNEWGVETLLRLADAVVDYPRKAVIRNQLTAVWRARLEGRIAEALVACERMGGDEAKSYRRRIADLRSALASTLDGRRAATAKAQATLAARRQTLGA